jgi:hypothetical protein
MSKKESKTKSVPIVRERDPNVTVYYCNDSLVQHTQWEVQLNFGRVLAPIKKDIEEIRIRQDLVVCMTLEHAEAFLQALSSHLQKARAARADMAAVDEKGEDEE